MSIEINKLLGKQFGVSISLNSPQIYKSTAHVAAVQLRVIKTCKECPVWPPMYDPDVQKINYNFIIERGTNINKTSGYNNKEIIRIFEHFSLDYYSISCHHYKTSFIFTHA